MTFTTRSLLLLAAAIATLYPMVRGGSFWVCGSWFLTSSVLWSLTGFTIHRSESRRKNFAVLGVVPFCLLMLDYGIVSYNTSIRSVSIVVSVPDDLSTEVSAVEYVPLANRKQLPDALREKFGGLTPVAVNEKPGQQMNFSCLQTNRSSLFGNSWNHRSHYEAILFRATTFDGKNRYGIVAIPSESKLEALQIDWQNW